MPSHLTRHVFHRLLANEPLVYRGCLRWRAYSTRPFIRNAERRRVGGNTSFVAQQQHRMFFNFNMFRCAKKDAKEADMDPGIEKMMELERMQRMSTRLPPREDVAKAFVAFFIAKKFQRLALEDTQANLALLSLQYCCSSGDDVVSENRRFTIDGSKLLLAAKVVGRRPRHMTEAHLRLATTIYEELVRRDAADPKFTALHAYCRTLCFSGNSDRARRLLLQREEQFQNVNQRTSAENMLDEAAVDEDTNVDDDGVLDKRNPMVLGWYIVLRGFAKQNDEVEVQRTLRMIQDRRVDAKSHAVPRIMLEFYLGKGNPSEVGRWWQEYWLRRTSAMDGFHVGISDRPSIDGRIVELLLKWCLVNNDLKFGHEVVTDVMRVNPSKPVWDAIFVWAAGTGKGVDEIDRMIDVMEQSNDIPSSGEAMQRRPDIATINALVKFANSKDDPYMAERFISLGRERKIEPDADTYVLQIDYRLGVNDVDGALTAYKKLQSVDQSSDNDLAAVNRLIVALCQSQRHDFDTIMNVAADLSDRGARFEPLTVSMLSLLHLSRDEFHDTVDLLNTHAYHYSSSERQSIRETIVAYCLDPATPTSRAWDVYTILRGTFDEMARDQRTGLMTSFFRRDRPDMAVHIFQHMRAHSRADTMPTTDTYVSAFMGTAKLRDLESLEVVHNQLKLDYNINLSTYLRNALIISYTACGKPRKALGFWDDIVASKEGPSYNSIHIALRACEKSHFGDLKAKEIWEKLRKMNVELDTSLWASYIAALGGNGDTETAIRTLEEAEAKGELEVDEFVLGSLFEAVPGYVKQGEVEAWAKTEHAPVWNDLEKLGVEDISENGTRNFKIDRSVTP